jgi:hypothetical protein
MRVSHTSTCSRLRQITDIQVVHGMPSCMPKHVLCTYKYIIQMVYCKEGLPTDALLGTESSAHLKRLRVEGVAGL